MLSPPDIYGTVPHTKLDALTVGIHIQVNDVTPHAGILRCGKAVDVLAVIGDHVYLGTQWQDVLAAKQSQQPSSDILSEDVCQGGFHPQDEIPP